MQSTPDDLFKLLVSKDFDVKTLDAKGKENPDTMSAEMFSFDFAPGDSNYGTVVILLNSSNELEMFYGDNVGKSMEGEDKKLWFDFLNQLRQFSKRHLLGFKLQ